MADDTLNRPLRVARLVATTARDAERGPMVPFGDVVLRDVVGASPSEIVRVIKPDLDSRGRRGALA